MPQKSLTTEKVEELRSLRSQGISIHDVAARAGVSEGAVSNYTRDIAKPARRTQVKKEGSKSKHESKDTTTEVVGGPYDEDTKELANQVKRARLQAELDEVADRKRQRQEIEDLRVRERKLMLQLDEARIGAGKGDGAVLGEITQLRGELSELRESRHQAEIRAIEDRHSGEVRRLEQQIASIGRSGLTQYDLMSQAMGKVEGLVALAGSKVDSFMSSNRSDTQFALALQLGLSPEELAILKRGLETPMTREQFMIIKKASGIEPQEGEYEALLALTERRNRQYQELAAMVAPRLRQGAAVRIGKPGKVPDPGKAPEPGQPEPAILKAESKLVKCTRCGCEFDIDLAEARQQAAAGKKLFVHCPGKGCGFMLDIMELLPELVKPQRPECYQVSAYGEPGCANRGHYESCRDCQWREVVAAT
ncbi:hypothetical protein ES703_65023 [subsurface metagenome]